MPFAPSLPPLTYGPSQLHLTTTLNAPVSRLLLGVAVGLLSLSISQVVHSKPTPPPRELTLPSRELSANTLSAEALTLPSAQLERWRALLSAEREGPLVTLNYGDSHTQGAFLSRALRDHLTPLDPQAPTEPSPGFVHQGHPHAWGGQVRLDGVWLRQNWIYGRDRGPFGPLGISFTTQDRAAEVTLELDRPPLTTPSLVRLFYVEEPHRLGFCVRALPDQEQAQRAAARVELLREAVARQASLFVGEPSSAAQKDKRLDSASAPKEGELLAHGSQPSSSPSFGGEGEGSAGELELTQEALSDSSSPSSEAFSATLTPTQRETLKALLSTEGLCVSPSLAPKRPLKRPSKDKRSSASGEEPSTSLESLETLELPLPPGFMLRLESRGGAAISDATLKRWRKDRAYALKKRREPRTPPHLIFPDKARLRVLGFHVRYPTARSEWSSLGVRGARVKSAATRSEGAVEALAKLTSPHLFVLWFGTNSAAAESVNLSAYEAHYRALIHSLKRGAPNALCLLITPPDFGRRPGACFLNNRERRVLKRKRKNAWARQLLSERREARVCDPDALLNLRKRGRYRYPVPEARDERTWEAYKEQCKHRTPKLIFELTALQERLAQEEGCALYHTMSAMGGEGAMQRWACAEPSWAQLDLVHLSVRGYEALGAHIALSLQHKLGLKEAPPPLTPPSEPSTPHP